MPSRSLGIHWDLVLHHLHQVIFFGTLAVFTTVNTALQVPGFPAGTTDEWELNSSSAILNLSSGKQCVICRISLGWYVPD
ncbi:Cell surface protein [Bacillus thuringiensis serovar israelensis ATCC 35646]|nr:Cell surface protein [Bacillus thuringiensis serovar israelensis ATCC 35646]